ncbi:hypothetical protein CYMTET_5741, partial [Cymbomonas tetramitiformis]
MTAVGYAAIAGLSIWGTVVGVPATFTSVLPQGNTLLMMGHIQFCAMAAGWAPVDKKDSSLSDILTSLNWTFLKISWGSDVPAELNYFLGTMLACGVLLLALVLGRFAVSGALTRVTPVTLTPKMLVPPRGELVVCVLSMPCIAYGSAAIMAYGALEGDVVSLVAGAVTFSVFPLTFVVWLTYFILYRRIICKSHARFVRKNSNHHVLGFSQGGSAAATNPSSSPPTPSKRPDLDRVRASARNGSSSDQANLMLSHPVARLFIESPDPEDSPRKKSWYAELLDEQWAKTSNMRSGVWHDIHAYSRFVAQYGCLFEACTGSFEKSPDAPASISFAPARLSAPEPFGGGVQYMILHLARLLVLSTVHGACSAFQPADGSLHVQLLSVIAFTGVQFFYCIRFTPFMDPMVHLTEAVAVALELGLAVAGLPVGSTRVRWQLSLASAVMAVQVTAQWRFLYNLSGAIRGLVYRMRFQRQKEASEELEPPEGPGGREDWKVVTSSLWRHPRFDKSLDTQTDKSAAGAPPPPPPAAAAAAAAAAWGGLSLTCSPTLSGGMCEDDGGMCEDDGGMCEDDGSMYEDDGGMCEDDGSMCANLQQYMYEDDGGPTHEVTSASAMSPQSGRLLSGDGAGLSAAASPRQMIHLELKVAAAIGPPTPTAQARLWWNEARSIERALMLFQRRLNHKLHCKETGQLIKPSQTRYACVPSSVIQES